MNKSEAKSTLPADVNEENFEALWERAVNLVMRLNCSIEHAWESVLTVENAKLKGVTKSSGQPDVVIAFPISDSK